MRGYLHKKDFALLDDHRHRVVAQAERRAWEPDPLFSGQESPAWLREILRLLFAATDVELHTHSG